MIREQAHSAVELSMISTQASVEAERLVLLPAGSSPTTVTKVAAVEDRDSAVPVVLLLPRIQAENKKRKVAREKGRLVDNMLRVTAGLQNSLVVAAAVVVAEWE